MPEMRHIPADVELDPIFGWPESKDGPYRVDQNPASGHDGAPVPPHLSGWSRWSQYWTEYFAAAAGEGP